MQYNFLEEPSVKQIDEPQLLKQYDAFRKTSRQLTSQIMDSISPSLMTAAGLSLGLFEDGQWKIAHENEIVIMIDYIVYQQTVQGLGIIDRYLKANRKKLTQEELACLYARKKAFFTVVKIKEACGPGTIAVDDLTKNEANTLIDRQLAETAIADQLIAGHFIPWGDYLICSGASMLVDASAEKELKALSKPSWRQEEVASFLKKWFQRGSANSLIYQ